MPTFHEQLPGSLGVEQTLRRMASKIDGAITDQNIRAQAATATRHCDRNNLACRCASLSEWVRRRLRFIPDAEGVEMLHDPTMIAEALRQRRFVYGDCDDYAMYLGALMKSVGIPVRVRAVGYAGGPYKHVYVMCGAMKLDPTRDDWEMPMGMMRRETSSMTLDLSSGRVQLEGLDLGKMFKRMFTFKPSSFSLKNISGAVGSAVSTIATGGLGPVFAPESFGAHGSVAKITGAMATAGGILPSIAPKLWGLKEHEANWVRGITASAAAAIGGTVVGPQLMSMLGPKLSAAASKLGGKLGEKALTSVGSQLVQSLMPMAPAQQLQAAQEVTADDIVEWDQTGAMPAHLQPTFYRAAAQSAPRRQPSPYTPRQMQAEMTPPAQAGIFGDPMTMMLTMSMVGLVVYVAMGDRGRVRR